MAGCLFHRLPKLSRRSLAIRSNGTRGHPSVDRGDVAYRVIADIARIVGVDLGGGATLVSAELR
jgi:hypothetical protein